MNYKSDQAVIYREAANENSDRCFSAAARVPRTARVVAPGGGQVCQKCGQRKACTALGWGEGPGFTCLHFP